MKPPQDSPHFPNAFYRVTAKGLYVKDGKVLLVNDYVGRSGADDSPKWELPGGGVDFGENLVEALAREIKEEMGLTVTSIDKRPSYVWTTKHVSSRSLDWYWVLSALFRFETENLNFIPSDECREIRFFSKNDLVEHYADLAVQVKPLAERFNPADFK